MVIEILKSMYRFYCPNTDFQESIISIVYPKEIHHIKNVLRLKKNDRIKIFNDQGEEVVVTILTISNDQLKVHKEAFVSFESSQRTKIHLACAIPKKAKFEWIIEKVTELNCDCITPLITQRTEINLNEERAAKKRERYQTVAVNAAKQCGRASVPRIQPPTRFSDFLESIHSNTLILIPCLAGSRQPLSEIFSKAKIPSEVIITIGPEGDFTDDELSLAIKKGAVPVTLGSTVLKVDTAAVSAVAWVHLFLDYESHKSC